MTSSLATRRASIIEASRSVSLKKYIDGLRKKQQEDENYSKWDINVFKFKYLNLNLF